MLKFQFVFCHKLFLPKIFTIEHHFRMLLLNHSQVGRSTNLHTRIRCPFASSSLCIVFYRGTCGLRLYSTDKICSATTLYAA